MGTVEVRLSAFLHYDTAISLWGLENGMWWFEESGTKVSSSIRRCDLVGVGVVLF